MLAVSAAAAAAMSAAMSAAAAEGSVSDVVREAAVNGLTVCRLHDIMPTYVLRPPKGLKGLVSHPSEELYTILFLMASASTCHKYCVLQSLLIHYVMCCKTLVHIIV